MSEPVDLGARRWTREDDIRTSRFWLVFGPYPAQGVSRMTVADAVKGQVADSVIDADRILKYLGIDPTTLMGDLSALQRSRLAYWIERITEC